MRQKRAPINAFNIKSTTLPLSPRPGFGETVDIAKLIIILIPTINEVEIQLYSENTSPVSRARWIRRTRCVLDGLLGVRFRALTGAVTARIACFAR